MRSTVEHVLLTLRRMICASCCVVAAEGNPVGSLLLVISAGFADISTAL